MDEALRRAYREDGAVMIRGLLSPAQLAQCRAAFDWAIENPGPHASKMYANTGQRSHVDNCNPIAKPKLDDLVASLPLGRTFADLWGAEHAWYFAEEVFLKEGGVGARTLWHQDTSYLPWGGQHWGNAWISFEAVPKANALEILRGSHRGPRYDGTTFMDPDDPTDPLHADPQQAGAAAWPRMPDVEAERRANPAAFDVLSWATEPGDVLILHPASLHGGAPVDAAFPNRHTLVLRFFGDDATFSPLPDESRSGYARDGVLFKNEMSALEPGAPFRAPVFRQVA
ncbi:MAG: phytanoyl-CoA dioxygenase family protein [Phenylobacterium sp.]|uniref:phytanoyl-CoA dioxygenase family protein n=1 Tax=Phenylobacterium sp. TaxID=1871053 RepID=UPI001A62D10D|nr:phytanoyl-CoA dioxygenase family protein [Phenylobacterium sp.]MBL8554560.1 phytanoyl-CoA dioxygenase family protein [Phenylobacterium sp.]